MAFTTEEQIAPYATKYGFTFEEGMIITVYSTTQEVDMEHRSVEHITGLATEQIIEQQLRCYATQMGAYKEVCVVGGDIPVAADVAGGWTVVEG